MGYWTIECHNEKEWLDARMPYANASSFAAIRNHSPWQTALGYWREKHGLIAHQAENASMLRGKERESEIRRWFAEENPWYTVQYHQYDIYVSARQGYGMLSCTLDGELEVNTDATAMQKGEKGILEIKSVGIRSANDIWDRIPQYYLDQVLGQLFIRDDCSFAVLVAEFHYEGSAELQGSIPEFSRKRFMIYRSKLTAEIQSVADDVALWWRAYMEEDRMPPAVVQGGTEESHDLVVITADAVIGSFEENFASVRKQIEDMVAPYEGYEVTEENLKNAKALHAELSKMEKEIDQKRIAVKKKYMEPCDAFEKKANELKALITEKRTPIKSQIDGFEEKRVEARKKLIADIYMKVADEKLDEKQKSFFFDHCHGYQKADPSWLNKSSSEKKIAEEIGKALDSFLSDIALIETLADGSELRDASYFTAYSRNMSIEDVMQSKKVLDYQEEARKKEEAEKAEAKALAPAPEPAPIAEEKPEIKEEKHEGITYRFVATHSDAKEWLALIKYMKDHGFTVVESVRI